MNLFLDDLKEPAWYDLDNVVVVRTFKQAVRYVKTKNEPIETLYLDHDLGGEKTGYDFLTLLVEDLKIIPKEVVIISFNFVGSKRIQSLCEQYDIFCKRATINMTKVTIIGGQSG